MRNNYHTLNEKILPKKKQLFKLREEGKRGTEEERRLWLEIRPEEMKLRKIAIEEYELSVKRSKMKEEGR